jgi:putative membrane protein
MSLSHLLPRLLASLALAVSASPASAHSLIDGALAQRLPALLTGLLLATAWLVYLAGCRRVAPRPGRAWLFHGSAGLAGLSLLGPFDDWAKTGAALHMAQHMLLICVIAPFWVLARPLPQWRAALGGRLRRLWLWPVQAAQHPLAMTAVHGAMIWFWHAPRPYLLALDNPWWHAIEHACFLFSAGLFWWAVLRAKAANRGRAMLALWITLMHTGLLGALLTFARTPLYGDASDLADQQLAGLIMWVPGGLVYLLAAAGCGHLWLRQLWRRSTGAALSKDSS